MNLARKDKIEITEEMLLYQAVFKFDHKSIQRQFSLFEYFILLSISRVKLDKKAFVQKNDLPLI